MEDKVQPIILHQTFSEISNEKTIMSDISNDKTLHSENHDKKTRGSRLKPQDLVEPNKRFMSKKTLPNSSRRISFQSPPADSYIESSPIQVEPKHKQPETDEHKNVIDVKLPPLISKNQHMGDSNQKETLSSENNASPEKIEKIKHNSISKKSKFDFGIEVQSDNKVPFSKCVNNLKQIKEEDNESEAPRDSYDENNESILPLAKLDLLEN